jgi:hypothetical protein
MSPMDASCVHQRWNYFRPLDWRHVAAKWLMLARRPRRRRYPVDPVVARLAGVLRAAARPMKQGRRADPSFDQLAWREAVALRDGAVSRRNEIEARILAGQSDAEIAAVYGMSAAAIEWHEAAFFNVRDRLLSATWVVDRVIGVAFPAGDDGPVLKKFGYFGGPKNLEVVLAVMRSRPLPPFVTTSFQNDPIYEERRLRLLVGLNVAALRATTYAELAALADLYAAARVVDAARTDVPRALRSDLRLHAATLRMAANAAGRHKARLPKSGTSTFEPTRPQAFAQAQRRKPVASCPTGADLFR